MTVYILQFLSVSVDSVMLPPMDRLISWHSLAMKARAVQDSAG